MRTFDDAQERARALYALARATAHPDEALVCVLRAMELEAQHPKVRTRPRLSVRADRVGTADKPTPRPESGRVTQGGHSDV